MTSYANSMFFFAYNCYGDHICSNLRGSLAHVSSSLMDVNPRGHLEANNCFYNDLEYLKNSKWPQSSQILWFSDYNSYVY